MQIPGKQSGEGLLGNPDQGPPKGRLEEGSSGYKLTRNDVSCLVEGH